MKGFVISTTINILNVALRIRIMNNFTFLIIIFIVYSKSNWSHVLKTKSTQFFLAFSSSSILVFSLAFDQHSKNFLLLCLKACTSAMVSGNNAPKVSGSNKDKIPPKMEQLPKISIGKYS